MSSVRPALGVTAIAAILGVGFGTWIVMSPGEERRNKLVKNMPEASPVKMEEMRRRKALFMQELQRAAETKDNISRDQ